MTRSRIQRIKFFVFLLIFLLAQSAVCNGSFREARTPTSMEKNENASVKKASAQHSPPRESNDQQSAVLPEDTTISDGNKTSVDLNPKSSVDTNRTMQHKEHFGDTLNPGALLRGIYVFVGLSVLVMAYIVFRSFRFSKTRAQMVRKYGILAHRQDVEMRPLPLEEEDDEDTTVFDASNVLTNNVQHQNL